MTQTEKKPNIEAGCYLENKSNQVSDPVSRLSRCPKCHRAIGVIEYFIEEMPACDEYGLPLVKNTQIHNPYSG